MGCHGESVTFLFGFFSFFLFLVFPVARMFSSFVELFTGPKPIVPRPSLQRQPAPLVDAILLRKSMSGAVLVPEGEFLEEYLERRWDRSWNIDVIETPSAIVIPQNEKDVQAVRNKEEEKRKGVVQLEDTQKKRKPEKFFSFSFFLSYIQVVSFAAARVGKVKLGVACGRHSSLCLKDDTLVLDLRNLNSISVDPAAKIVSFGGSASVSFVVVLFCI
jgi:hypothetical protein